MDYMSMLACVMIGGLLLGSTLAMIKIVWERWSR